MLIRWVKVVLKYLIQDAWKDRRLYPPLAVLMAAIYGNWKSH